MRRIVSILMVICFLGLVTTALTMLLADQGGERNRARLGQIQMDVASSQSHETQRPQKKFFPKEAHEMFGVTFMVIGCTHLILNRRIIYRYLMGR